MLIATTKTTVWGHFQARFAEWQNAVILFAWGTYLILHPGMMTDPKTAGLWTGLLAVANQETWGMIALIVGIARMAALYVNGQHKRTPLVRLVASFFSAFILTQIVVGMVNNGVSNTGLIVYPALVLADIYSAFRASSDMTFVARQNLPATEEADGRVVSFAKPS